MSICHSDIELVNVLQLDAMESNFQQRFILALMAFEYVLFSDAVGWLSDKDESEWTPDVKCDEKGEVITSVRGGTEIFGQKLFFPKSHI